MKSSYEELEKKLDEVSLLLKKALAKISELEEKLNLNSNNSSKPPSTDQKSNTPNKEKKPRSSRKGKSRTPFPKDRVDRQIECGRDSCAHCGSENIEQLNNLLETLQQVELPVIRATVTEYIVKKYKCISCGKKSSAELPEGVENTVFGPGVMALFTTLTGVYHLAKREAIALIKELYDIDISLGSASNIEERVAEALDPVCTRIHQFIMKGSLCKHFDETGWRNLGKKRYVWVLSCKQAAYYQIDPSRSREAFERIIGQESKNLNKVVTDRYGVYNSIKGHHQYCLAHLIRDFRRFAERKGADGPLGEALEKELSKACKIHGEYRKGEITKKQRNYRLSYRKRRVEFCLDDAFANGSDKLSSLCGKPLEKFSNLWAFTNVDDMEPTNNLAERDLRKLVIWRKKSYGTRSDRGEFFVSRITTVAETLKRHGMSAIKYIKKALKSAHANILPKEIVPSLGF